MLKKRDDVGESFMEGEYVRIGGLAEAPVQAIKQRVCRLMGHDIVGRRRENDSSGQRGSRIRAGSGEIAEQEGLTLRAVARIRYAFRHPPSSREGPTTRRGPARPRNVRSSSLPPHTSSADETAGWLRTVRDRSE